MQPDGKIVVPETLTRNASDRCCRRGNQPAIKLLRALAAHAV
jgi:hypothetical protein